MKVKQGQAIYVPTGGFVPDGADVMVMIEHTELLQENVLIYKKHAIYQNMIKMGKDISKNTPFMKQYTRVTPRVIGALMSQNNKTVSVYKKLTFTVISTGDEITNKETITLGQVRDINTHTIAASIQSKHHLVNHTAVVQDDFEAYKNEIFKGFTHSDIVISSGGSSVGEKDYTHRILEEMGGDIFVHGLNIKPGKPTILAIYQDKLFIGLPGHPLSAYIILHLLLETILDIIYHTKTVQTYYEGTLSESVHNLSGRTLIQLVRVEEDNITPIYYKSAMINVLKDADGYIVIDQSSEGKYKGEIVKVYKLGD